MNIAIRKAAITDVDQIRFLFRDTVLYINVSDYNDREIQVWSDCYKQKDRWEHHISAQYFLVATVNGQIVGFSSLEDSGYLDFMYVHKDFQRVGVAIKLLMELERRAQILLLKQIYSHVSKTAIPFFERNGFVKTGNKINIVENISFVNSIMTKQI